MIMLNERKRAEEERNQLLSQLRTLNTELEERVQARTAELQANLKEREVLLQEVHHRVKNNLQVISSLISMQVRSLGNDGSREALEECQTRVQAIALIHEQLYRSKDYARVPFADVRAEPGRQRLSGDRGVPRTNQPGARHRGRRPGGRPGHPLRSHPERAHHERAQARLPRGAVGDDTG